MSIEYTCSRVFVRSKVYVPCSRQAAAHLSSSPSRLTLSGTRDVDVARRGGGPGVAGRSWPVILPEIVSSPRTNTGRGGVTRSAPVPRHSARARPGVRGVSAPRSGHQLCWRWWAVAWWSVGEPSLVLRWRRHGRPSGWPPSVSGTPSWRANRHRPATLVMRRFRRWTRSWWCQQTRIPFSTDVGPSSRSHHSTWCTSPRLGGALHPGYWQCLSRAITARRCWPV